MLFAMKTLYRLEDDKRQGVYTTLVFDELLEEFGIMWPTDRSPSPIDDTLLKKNYEKHPKLSILDKSTVRYCFDSKAKLLKWFDENFLRKAFALGLKVVVYNDVPDALVIEGESQDVMTMKAYTKYKYVTIVTFEDFQKLS